MHQETGLLQFPGALGEELPGLGWKQLQVFGFLPRQGSLQRREERHGAGQTAQQDLAGLEHHWLGGGFPETSHRNGIPLLGLQSHLHDPAFFAQTISVLDGFLGRGNGRRFQPEAWADPLLARAFTPLLELLAEGPFRHAHGGELVHGMAEGHHDALVPGEAIALVAAQTMDETESWILALAQGARHEAHQEVGAILQEGAEQLLGARRHRQLVVQLFRVQGAQSQALGEDPHIVLGETEGGGRHGLDHLLEGFAVGRTGEADAPGGAPGISSRIQLGKQCAANDQGL